MLENPKDITAQEAFENMWDAFKTFQRACVDCGILKEEEIEEESEEEENDG